MRIVIRTDGSPTLGMGHVTRSVAVADELRELGAGVAFGGASGMAAKYIVEHGHVAVWPNPDQIDAVLNDLPPNGVSPNRWQARQFFMADLLTGPEMMPLRREVLRARELRDHFGHYGVLVTSGWSDSFGVSAALREMRSIDEARIEPTMPETMLAAAQRCSIAVVGMGMTAWELACVGVPMVVVALNDQYEKDSESLWRAGCALVVTPVNQYGFGVAEDAARALLADRAKLHQMGIAGRTLVDGLGARRVAEKIMEEAGRC
jgi:spore coat polysaccharide biosynthesis predicted glycosyltransferase SpsG